jgi:hypothetical protein
MKEKAMVMFDSPEAATYRTDIKGWVSRDGRYYGEDERSARWGGCTHTTCACGAVLDKNSYTKCRSCMATDRTAKYYALPMVEWDFETPLASFDDDKFFFTDEDVLDWMADLLADAKDGETPEVQLVLCTPGKLGLIDSDHWCDDLHEDGELPDEVLAKVAELNEALKNAPTVTWWAGTTRINVDALWAKLKEDQRA